MPDLRVLVQSEADGLVCHVGIFRRDVTWNGRIMRAGGIGGVATRDDRRGRGYASIALDAAIQTLKDEGSIDFALLFCEPHLAPFYASPRLAAVRGRGLLRTAGAGPRSRSPRSRPTSSRSGRRRCKGTIDLCGLPGDPCVRRGWRGASAAIIDVVHHL